MYIYIPFVVIYQPSLSCLNRMIKNNLNILYMSCEIKAVFSPELMVSFRSARRFSSYLVRAKLYPLERFVGSRQCEKRRCKICTNVTEIDTFSVTGETFQINHERNCNDKCLIYSLKCIVLWKHHKDNDIIF